MSFDVDDPPRDPPDTCRHRLLWRLARSLWEEHQPDSAGFCMAAGCWHDNQLSPCRLAHLAAEGMRTACGEVLSTSPPWLDLVRNRLADCSLDPVDAVGETLWHRRHGGILGGER